MKGVDKFIERQLPYWLIGPILIFWTSYIAFIKFPYDYAYLPLLGLMGIALCWKWPRLGLAISLSLISATLFYKFTTIPPDQRLWHFGLGFSLTLTFIVSALSFEEIEAHQDFNQQDSIHNLTDALKKADEQIQHERNALSIQRELFEKTISEQKTQLQHNLNTIELLQSELLQSHLEKEKITEELFQKQAEFSSIQAQLKEALIQSENHATDNLVSSNDRKEIEQLIAKLSERENHIAELHLQLQEVREELQKTKKKIDGYIQEIASEKEHYNAQKLYSEQAQKEQTTLQTINQELQEHLETLNREKDLLSSSLQKLQIERTALQEQDQHHQALIDSHEKMIELLKHTMQEQEQRMGHEKEELVKTTQKALALSDEAANKQKQLDESILNQIEIEKRFTEATQLAKRYEGMYLQLRQQFTEKSTLLDEARRERFLAEEQLLGLKHEQKEATLYHRSAENRAYDLHLIRVQKVIEEYEQEIECLHDLIKKILEEESRKTEDRSQENLCYY